MLNRVTQVEENGATSGPGLLASYGYDSLGRRSLLTRAGGAGAGTGYNYDPASRLYTLTQTLAGTASVTYTPGYNAANQVLTKDVSNAAYIAHPGPITAGYVSNGLNQYTGATGVAASGATGTALSYDPTDRLQTQTTAGATTNFLYSGDALVGEYDASGNILARYVMGPGVDEPLVWYQGAGATTRSWLTADNQGSVIGYAGPTGVSGATYRYGPYGEPIVEGGGSAWGGSRYRFTGQIEIPEAEVYFFKARVYDPNIGSFYQTDPAGLNGGLNLYAYATEDPVNGSDPSGLGPGTTCYGTLNYDGTGITCYYSEPGFKGFFDFIYRIGSQIAERRDSVTRDAATAVSEFLLIGRRPQNVHSCPGVDFSAGGSLNGALISPGGSVGAGLIVHVPFDLRHGWQVSVVGQGTFTWGLGAFIGAGASFGFPASSSTQQSGGSTFKTGDFIAEGGCRKGDHLDPPRQLRDFLSASVSTRRRKAQDGPGL